MSTHLDDARAALRDALAVPEDWKHAPALKADRRELAALLALVAIAEALERLASSAAELETR